MTRVRAKFVRSAFTLLFSMMAFAAVPVAQAGANNDAALVMDAESGRVLYARSGDAQRIPASLTKMMTLYLLFDALDSGKVKLTDEMDVSAHAAAQSPTKLYVEEGDTLTVEQAIYGIVIVSANDAAVTIAEHLGGSEEQFAAMMTAKARQLGMRRTLYRNASGLPNPEQTTTARDLAILARALMHNHPRLFQYFSATSFTWRGKTIMTHNRVLTGLEGANGIKTGYTRASGFNLTTSAQRNGKRLIGVVMGGDTWAQRDSDMKVMLEAWFAQLERRPNLVASYSNGAPVSVADAGPSIATTPRATVVAAAAPEKIQPVVAQIQPAKRVVAMAPIPDSDEDEDSSDNAAVNAKKAAPEMVSFKAPTPAAKPAKVVPKAVAIAKADDADDNDDAPVTKKAELPKAKAPVVVAAVTKRNKDGTLPLSTLVSNNPDDIATLIAAGYSPNGHAKKLSSSEGGWGIQIGAFDSKATAETQLSKARSAAKATLADADETVVSISSKGRTFFRARFTSFSNNEAQAACSKLKAKGFECATFSSATASAL